MRPLETDGVIAEHRVYELSVPELDSLIGVYVRSLLDGAAAALE
jgi:hypothetical protein